CRVIIKRGRAPITEEDREALSPRELDRGMRLACRFAVQEDLVVEIPGGYTREGQVILEESAFEVSLDPQVKALPLSITPPSLDYPRGDLERVCDFLGEELWASPETLWNLPDPLEGQVTAVVRDHELLDLLSGEERAYGAAVDIGTTTVVAYLMDLLTGEELAVRSVMNPQIKYGDDVISRITHSMEREEGREELMGPITRSIGDLVKECCRSASVSPERVYEAVMVGNTAMHHFLWGLDPSNLALCPYIPVTSSTLQARWGRKLGINPGGYVFTPPNLAGFVGADHTAVLLSCALWEEEAPHLVIDIGTNGEISLGSSEGIHSCSCAAGPAFEGGNLTSGMRGTAGAVDHLRITEDMGVRLSTIGGGRPRGICGSGIVDAVSELFKAGVLDPSGRIAEELEWERIRVCDGQSQVVLATERESDTGEPVVITQEDVVQVLYAKAAMYAGATLLMDAMGVSRRDLESILVAGAFGNYISPESARGIGIFPEVDLERVRGVGNAAGAGAKMMLLNREARRRARELADRVNYIELAAHPDFEEKFYQALYLPHFEEDLFPEVMASRRGNGPIPP
ncbi:MAG: ASKHA domain-containing protein, partial [Thermoplasmatota archaeon]